MRFMTRNVQHDAGDPRRLDLLNRELRTVSPDVVMFQEVRYPDQLGALVAGTRLRHVTHQTDVLPGRPPEVHSGTAVVSRLPHRVVDVVERRIGGFHYWTLAVALDGWRVVTPTTPWHPDAAAVRHRQAVELTERHGGPGTVVAGDLNATPDEPAVRHLAAHFQDAWAVAGDGPGTTWSQDNPLAAAEISRLGCRPGRIDYVFAGSGVRVVSVGLVGDRPVDGVWLSDHAGVVADLAFPG
jgi:endonuclease/exonuclease/phosphatase family metal-dependent hydrolase